MTVTEIIQRAAQGEPLSAEECEVLKSYQSSDDLRSEMESITAERDQLSNQLTALTQQNAISKIAQNYQFSDPEYLAYRFSKVGITPDSEEAMAFMEQLKNEQPKFFKIDITPGVPTPQASSSGSSFTHNTFADELTRLLESAPEIR